MDKVDSVLPPFWPWGGGGGGLYSVILVGHFMSLSFRVVVFRCYVSPLRLDISKSKVLLGQGIS